jgi:multisubunit Na+/H+ antiporter MnhG subunit
MCVGGYFSLNALWNGTQKTIVADIGLRLVSTGYVVAVASGMADIFGIGSHPFPNVPYFGPWQAVGVMLGEVIIAIGFLMLIPYPFAKK